MNTPDISLTSITLKGALTPLIMIAAVYSFIEVWQPSTSLSQPSTKVHPELIAFVYLTH
jgi:hypothetical protein